MKKLYTKSFAIFASLALVVAGFSPFVMADSATNDTTGADSENVTNVKNENNIKVENVSDAYIKNDVEAYSNTGHNSASKNTMGGSVLTGDATTNVGILNSANINTTLIDLAGNGGTSTAGNSITGYDSENFADILNKNKVDVENDNTAVLKNYVEAKADTGNNWAYKNTDGIGGAIATGDALAQVSLKNRANDSATAISGLGNFGANVVGNSVTGADSVNTAKVKNENDVIVRNVSDAAVFNMVKAKSNTGRNSASKNTMGGMIGTGDATTGVELLTDANIVTTQVVSGMAGNQTTSGNSVTGADSDNFTTLENLNKIEVVNRNNKGDSEDAPDYENEHWFHNWGVVNENFDVADTGNNWADKNTYPASIATGLATAGKFIRVCLNDTLTTIGAVLP